MTDIGSKIDNRPNSINRNVSLANLRVAKDV